MAIGPVRITRSIPVNFMRLICVTAFDLDTVKLLMTMFDTDRGGTIAFNEVSIIHITPRNSS